MASATYLAGRKKYKRPQAMLWSDSAPTTVINPITSINLIPNSSFNATTNWNYASYGGGVGTLEVTPETIAHSATNTLKVTYVSGSSKLGIIHSGSVITVTPGQTYTFSMYVKDGNSSKQFISYIEWRQGTTVLSTSTGTTSTGVNTSSWTRVSVTATAPINADTVRLYTYSSSTVTVAGTYAYFDSAQFEIGSAATAYVEPEYIYVPQGFEVGELSNGNDFIILSDHNRKDMSFKPERIEKRERMINGRMRSYHVADKLTLSTSWDMLPSRSFSNSPNFDSSGVASPQSRVDNISGTTVAGTQYTVDGGAGGTELLEWYQNHTGSFWVFIAYDNHNKFSINEYSQLSQYGHVMEMFISSFDYNVVKRGGSNFDFWNVSVTLEEV
jgi:hypothetical protein